MTTLNEFETIIFQLKNKREECQQLLDFGAVKIEEKQAEGIDVVFWCDYWQDLLKEYGRLSDKITAAHNELKKLEKGAA